MSKGTDPSRAAPWSPTGAGAPREIRWQDRTPYVRVLVVPQPVLRTDRLLLVPLAEHHLDLEVVLDSDPEVLRFLYGRARSRAEVTKSHAERMALGRAVDGLGYWIAWGRDGGRRGSVAPGCEEDGEFVGLMMLPIGQNRVIAQTMAVNEGSRAVMQAIGMRYVRTYHQQWEDPLPGTELGEVEYELTREMWLASGGDM
jgi:RimJ/RimL family protein N-acetyltransferase